MVAALSGICLEQSFEGESGLKIEALYDPKIDRTYSYTIRKGVVDFDEMIQEIIQSQDKTEIASRFVNTLAKISVEFAKKHQLPVVLAGGVFQNRTLLEKISHELEKEYIPFYFQNLTPLNDGSLSLGQIYYSK